MRAGAEILWEIESETVYIRILESVFEVGTNWRDFVEAFGVRDDVPAQPVELK